jgi:hypothetical protein
MKKIKMALITAAILLAVGGAYGTRPVLGCESATQYRLSAGGYVEAGIFGVNYTCWTSGNTCTYYKPDPVNQPNTYAACRPGTWVAVQ